MPLSATRLSESVVYVPNNRRLSAQLELAALVPDDARRVIFRGEDIPFVINAMAARGERATGYTGDDLLDDWIARGNSLDARVRRSRIEWREPIARYGKPALCLIAARNRSFEPERARIAVCARYQRLAANYLTRAFGGDVLERVRAYSGGTERLIDVGLADAVIDIVVTGSTIDALGLEVVDVIYMSDLARLEVIV